MKTIAREKNKLAETKQLQCLADIVISSFTSLKVLPAYQFDNNIPDDIYVQADCEQIASVLGNLLSTMIRQSKPASINLTAKAYTDIVLLHMKEDKMQKITIDSSLQLMARKTGGVITVTSRTNHPTTVAFSFLNLPHSVSSRN